MSVVATITSAVAAISATSTINPEASIVAAIAASSTFDLNDLPSAFLSAAADASSSGPDPRLYWALIIILPVGFVLILSIATFLIVRLRREAAKAAFIERGLEAGLPTLERSSTSSTAFTVTTVATEGKEELLARITVTEAGADRASPRSSPPLQPRPAFTVHTIPTLSYK